MSKKCPKCGTDMADNAMFCGECGTKFENKSSEPYNFNNNQSQQNYTNFNSNNQFNNQNYAPNYGNFPNPLTTPMSLGEYILTMIIFAIPIAGFIMMIIWSFSSNVNLNKKNFSRASLIFYIISFIISMIIIFFFVGFMSIVIEEMAREGLI